MAKRWRKIAIVVGLVVVALILVGAARKAPRFGDQLALLKEIPSTHVEDRSPPADWVVYMSGPGGMKRGNFKVVKEIYRIREPFPSFNERAKKELKPISHGASAYPPKNPDITIYNTKNPQNRLPITIYIRDDQKGGTMVVTQEITEMTWIDSATEWFRGIFRR